MIDLDELMRLHDAATPGPWATEYRERENGMYGQDVFTLEDGEEIATISWYPKYLGNGVTSTYRDANAAYIVAACNAVPELVHRIRELEAQRDRLQDAAEFEARVAAKQATAICGQCDKFNSSGKGCPLAIFTRPGLDACRLKHARLAVEQEMLAGGKGTGRSVKS